VLAYVIALLVLVCVLMLVVRSLGAQAGSFDVVGLVGSEAEAVETFSELGRVIVRGEIWRAVTKRGIVQRGDKVRVVAVESELTLVVERAQ